METRTRSRPRDLRLAALLLALCSERAVHAAPGALLDRSADSAPTTPSAPSAVDSTASRAPSDTQPPKTQHRERTPAGALRGSLSASEVWSPEHTPLSPHLPPWVRPAGAVYASGSALLLLAVSTTEPPNLSLSFRHAPSALFSSGALLGLGGGTATLFVPDRYARPLLELSVTSSVALQALALARAPEPGVPAFGEYSVASGYALSTLLLGLDWALSPPAAMLDVSSRATPSEAPPRALSPYVVYAPALLGAVVSVSRALAPSMSAGDRGITLGLGAYALVPATAGLVLGLSSSERSPDRAIPDAWIAGGPRGSWGLSIGGSL